MADESQERVFSTMEEYLTYYQVSPEKEKAKGSKYYRLGTEIARLASEKAMHDSRTNIKTPQRIA